MAPNKITLILSILLFAPCCLFADAIGRDRMTNSVPSLDKSDDEIGEYSQDGTVSFAETLLTVNTNEALPYSVVLNYSSQDVYEAVRANNISRPTSLVGLGWTLNIPNIYVVHNGTVDTLDDKWYYKDENGGVHAIEETIISSGIYRVKDNIAYRVEKVKDASERLIGWLLIRADGSRLYFGDAERSGAKNGLSITYSVGNIVDLFAAGASEYYDKWCLTKIETYKKEADIRFVYMEKDEWPGITDEIMGLNGQASGICVTKSMYLKEIITSYSEHIYFGYVSKNGLTSLDPTPFAVEPDNDMDRIEKLLLDTVSIRYGDRPIARTIKLHYGTINIAANVSSLGSAQKEKYNKEVLDSISTLGPSRAELFPSRKYRYVNSYIAGIPSVGFGSIKNKVNPQGLITEFAYTGIMDYYPIQAENIIRGSAVIIPGNGFYLIKKKDHNEIDCRLSVREGEISKTITMPEGYRASDINVFGEYILIKKKSLAAQPDGITLDMYKKESRSIRLMKSWSEIGATLYRTSELAANGPYLMINWFEDGKRKAKIIEWLKDNAVVLPVEECEPDARFYLGKSFLVKKTRNNLESRYLLIDGNGDVGYSDWTPISIEENYTIESIQLQEEMLSVKLAEDVLSDETDLDDYCIRLYQFVGNGFERITGVENRFNDFIPTSDSKIMLNSEWFGYSNSSGMMKLINLCTGQATEFAWSLVNNGFFTDQGIIRYRNYRGDIQPEYISLSFSGTKSQSTIDGFGLSDISAIYWIGNKLVMQKDEIGPASETPFPSTASELLPYAYGYFDYCDDYNNIIEGNPVSWKFVNLDDDDQPECIYVLNIGSSISSINPEDVIMIGTKRCIVHCTKITSASCEPTIYNSSGTKLPGEYLVGGTFIDINGDGLVDLRYKHEIWINRGGYQFQQIACNMLSEKSLLTDLNGDGLIDIVVPELKNCYGVVRYYYNFGGEMWDSKGILVPFCSCKSLETINVAMCHAGMWFCPIEEPHLFQGDFNGDGLVDILAVTNQPGGDYGPYRTHIIFNLPDGGVAVEKYHAVNLRFEADEMIIYMSELEIARREMLPPTIVIGDFDGDGCDEYATRYEVVNSYENCGNITWQTYKYSGPEGFLHTTNYSTPQFICARNPKVFEMILLGQTVNVNNTDYYYYNRRISTTPNSLSNEYQLFDKNKDGYLDLLVYCHEQGTIYCLLNGCSREQKIGVVAYNQHSPLKKYSGEFIHDVITIQDEEEKQSLTYYYKSDIKPENRFGPLNPWNWSSPEPDNWFGFNSVSNNPFPSRIAIEKKDGSVDVRCKLSTYENDVGALRIGESSDFIRICGTLEGSVFNGKYDNRFNGRGCLNETYSTPILGSDGRRQYKLFSYEYLCWVEGSQGRLTVPAASWRPFLTAEFKPIVLASKRTWQEGMLTVDSMDYTYQAFDGTTLITLWDMYNRVRKKITIQPDGKVNATAYNYLHNPPSCDPSNGNLLDALVAATSVICNPVMDGSVSDVFDNNGIKIDNDKIVEILKDEATEYSNIVSEKEYWLPVFVTNNYYPAQYFNEPRDWWQTHTSPDVMRKEYVWNANGTYPILLMNGRYGYDGSKKQKTVNLYDLQEHFNVATIVGTDSDKAIGSGFSFDGEGWNVGSKLIAKGWVETEMTCLDIHREEGKGIVFKSGILEFDAAMTKLSSGAFFRFNFRNNGVLVGCEDFMIPKDSSSVGCIYHFVRQFKHLGNEIDIEMPQWAILDNIMVYPESASVTINNFDPISRQRIYKVESGNSNRQYALFDIDSKPLNILDEKGMIKMAENQGYSRILAQSPQYSSSLPNRKESVEFPFGNLLPYWSFEDEGDLSSFAEAPYWRPVGDALLKVVRDKKVYGERSLFVRTSSSEKVEGVALDIVGDGVHPQFTSMVGRTLTLSCWVYLRDSSERHIKILLDGTAETADSEKLLYPEQWTYITHTFNPVRHGVFDDLICHNKIRLSIVEANSVPAMELYLDGVVLEVDETAHHPNVTRHFYSATGKEMQTHLLRINADNMFSEMDSIDVQYNLYDYLDRLKDKSQTVAVGWKDGIRIYDGSVFSESEIGHCLEQVYGMNGNPFFRYAYYEDGTNRPWRTSNPGYGNGVLNLQRHVEYEYYTLSEIKIEGSEAYSPVVLDIPEIPINDGIPPIIAPAGGKYKWTISIQSQMIPDQLVWKYSHAIKDWKGKDVMSAVTKNSFLHKRDWNEDGAKMTFTQYDPVGNPLVEYNPSCFTGFTLNEDGTGSKTLYSYDAFKKLQTKMNPDAVGYVRYQYNQFGILRFMKDPNVIARKGSNAFMVNQYDPSGRLVKIVEVVPYNADVFTSSNCIDNMEWPQKQDVMEYRIVQENEYDYRSNLVRTRAFSPVANVYVESRYDYDKNDELIQIIEMIPNGKEGVSTQRHQYRYAHNGMVLEYAFSCASSPASSFVRKFDYDNRGRLKNLTIRRQNGAEIEDKIAADYEYNDPRGLLSRAALGLGLSGQCAYSQTTFYDVMGRPLIVNAEKPDGTILLQEELAYLDRSPSWITDRMRFQTETNGNITTVRYTGTTVSGASEIFTYEYDLFGQLLKSNYYDESRIYDGKYSSSTTYGKDGEVLSATKKDAISLQELTAEFIYESNTHKLLRVEGDLRGVLEGEINTFTYDANGNMIEDKTKRMVIDYDWRNMPVRFKLKDVDGRIRFVSEIVYDASGNRVAKSNFVRQ